MVTQGESGKEGDMMQIKMTATYSSHTTQVRRYLSKCFKELRKKEELSNAKAKLFLDMQKLKQFIWI